MKAINNKPIVISSIYDDINVDTTYLVKVIYPGNYSFKANLETNLYDENDNLLLSNINENKTIYLENKNYYIQVCSKIHNNYELIVKMDRVFFPYPVIDNTNPTNTLKVSKRKGSTFIYNNVPESMYKEVLNTIIMEQKGLEGECFLTFENQNKIGKDIYMGYRLTNEEDHPIYITITNIGYQIDGSWLGEKSWMDYWSVKFDIDMSFENKMVNYYGNNLLAHDWFKDYLNFDLNYKPNPINPTTYKLMPHTHMYVIGGTTLDSYNQINVNNTANLKITRNCINGNVKFYITNGKATGHLCVYDDIDKINSSDVIIRQLYPYKDANEDLAGRIGIEKNSGVVDIQASFVFDDNDSGNIPVKYIYKKGSFTNDLKDGEEIKNIKEEIHSSTYWNTHLSNQLHEEEYLDDDLVEHTTFYKGEKIILSHKRKNPVHNKLLDYGNWMIEYQDNFNFENKGTKKRKLSFFIENPGSIFYMIKDNQNNILKKSVTLETCTGKKPIYELEIDANEKANIILDYVLPANDCGNVKHYIVLW